MDDAKCRRIFTEWENSEHRRYEALRAVFVEGRRQKQVADEFGYSYQAFRQVIHRFRQDCRDGRPPFSFHPLDEAGLRTS